MILHGMYDAEMRAIRAAVMLLTLGLAAGPALDGCLVSCHVEAAASLSTHCHDATAHPTAGPAVRGLSRCTHDHNATWIGADEVRPEPVTTVFLPLRSHVAAAPPALAPSFHGHPRPTGPPSAIVLTVSPLRI
jgi:hypothetical protein